jgi:glycerol-3-phosphate acyltransferase PlsY
MTWQWAAAMVCAYVVGSIPFGVIIGKARGIDIRAHGSRNPGATNVARVLGKKLGLLCFALDFLKGAVPVLVAGVVFHVINTPVAALSVSAQWCWLGVAVASVVGHMFSLFLGFRGGKGVATSFGALMAMWPLLTIPALGAMVVWYAAVRLTHYVSVASMAAALSLPVGYLLAHPLSKVLDQPWPDTWAAIEHSSPALMVTSLLALVVIWKHRGNIARLKRGEEPKAGRPMRRGDMLASHHEDTAQPET